MAAIPCIPHALSASLAHLGMGFCNATKASWFSLDYLNSFFSMIMLIVPLFWSYFLYVLQHINTPLQKSLMAFEKPPSVLSALYYVLRPCPSLICVGHVLAPAASIFTLWFSPWPPSWLHSGALLSPHPGGRRTHLSHFWVPACCMFSGAAECNNVAWRNSRFFPSHNTHCRGCFLLWPLPSPLLDRIPQNHEVIYTRPGQLNHLGGVIPLHVLMFLL